MVVPLRLVTFVWCVMVVGWVSCLGLVVLGYGCCVLFDCGFWVDVADVLLPRFIMLVG